MSLQKDFYGTKKWTPVCYIAGFGDPEIEYLPRLLDTKTIGKIYIVELFQRPISGVRAVQYSLSLPMKYMLKYRFSYGRLR